MTASLRNGTRMGERVARREDPRLVRGASRFVDDIHYPGMLHMALLRSPHAHARIESIDLSAALALPGVAAAYSGESLRGIAPALPGVAGVPGIVSPEHHPLAQGKALFEGDPLAAVLARDRALAEDALEQIEVRSHVLPAVIDPERADEPGTPLLHEALGSNLSFAFALGGDRSAAVAAAAHVVRQRIDCQRLIPSPLETRGIVAHYEPDCDGLTIHLSTQAPHLLRTQIARYLGISEHRVRVIAPDVGGAFGAKLNPYAEELLAAALALHRRTTIKWIEDRLESMVATSHGRGQRACVEASADADGRITSLHLSLLLDIGAYHHILTPMGPFQTAMLMTGCYRIPCASVEIRGVFTNKTPVDPYRGFGRAEAAYYVERLMDILARRTGLDPVEIRRRNFIAPDAFPYTTPLGHVHEGGDYERCLEKALALVDYAGLRAEQTRLRAQGRHIGIGLATYTWRGGFPSQSKSADFDFIKGGWERATVRIEPGGEVTVLSGVSPHGQGLETCFSQIAAETLGVALEAVRVVTGDTACVPYGIGTMGSRSLVVGGSAVLQACEAVLADARRVAAHRLGTREDALRFEAGSFFETHDPARRFSLREIAHCVYSGIGLPPGLQPCLEATRVFDPPNFTSPFGCHLCVAEVDCETGAVAIRRYVAVDDCGRAINPALVEGQIHGGIAQGIGQALLEEAVYGESGQLLSHSGLDYLHPRCGDVPRIETVLCESPVQVNPLGARSVGEAGTVGAPPAVANAVMDALAPFDIEHLDTPLRPDRIWRALATARRRRAPQP